MIAIDTQTLIWATRPDDTAPLPQVHAARRLLEICTDMRIDICLSQQTVAEYLSFYDDAQAIAVQQQLKANYFVAPMDDNVSYQTSRLRYRRRQGTLAFASSRPSASIKADMVIAATASSFNCSDIVTYDSDVLRLGTATCRPVLIQDFVAEREAEIARDAAPVQGTNMPSSTQSLFEDLEDDLPSAAEDIPADSADSGFSDKSQSGG